MHSETLQQLQEALKQKEQALIQYVKYMREAQDSSQEELATLYSDLAKAEEKHVAVIRDQVARYSPGLESLGKYRQLNQTVAQEADDPHSLPDLME